LSGGDDRAVAGSHPQTVVIYTSPDANTSATVIPASMRAALADVAKAHGSILLIRVEGDGTVSTSTVDLTPRTSKGEVLQVPDRISTAVDESIAALEAEMNRPSVGTQSRALYQGLLQARIPADADVWVLSSGIDLESPIDARDLGWDVPVDDVLAVVDAAGAVPDLSGARITFVMNAPAGQQMIRSTQMSYLHSLWDGLLRNGGASSVEFIDMPPGEPASDQAVPVVPLPPLPSTPVSVTPDQIDPDAYSCTLQTSAGFVPDTDQLVDEAAVRMSLADCVSRMVPGSIVRLDGWTAYYGSLDANGRPATQSGVALSQRRCDRIASLLVSMGVPESAITDRVGHGSMDQPDPENPTSQSNRVVIVTVTPPK
jgi:outer membrane protein OmpA-like peptidoglycan-associated protein